MGGIGPSSLSTREVDSAGAAARTGLAEAEAEAIIRCSSTFPVFTNDNFVSRFASHPRARATTPMMTATPNPRRIQTSNDRDRFNAAKTLLPAKSAMPRDVAAPNANDSNKNEVRTPGPCIAAPVRIKPKIGPAQGVQSKPVEIPNKKDFPMPDPGDPLWSPDPTRTSGRVRNSAKEGNSRVSPKT